VQSSLTPSLPAATSIPAANIGKRHYRFLFVWETDLETGIIAGVYDIPIGASEMKKQLQIPKLLPRNEARRRGQEFLREIQKDLLPENASRLVAINLEDGQYVLGDDELEVGLAFHERFPGQIPYVVRVDGGPVVKFHGM
jgi:hypothetical protein